MSNAHSRCMKGNSKEKSLPSLSVILPNYNHARFLPTSLQAILDQSVPAQELIVIDDASTDNSVDVIESFAAKHPSIRLVRNDKNCGVVYGMNRGLELATSDYVGFAAADDQVRPGLFEKSLRLLAEHPNAALCCTIGEFREVTSGLVWHVGVNMSDAPCYLDPDQLVDLERQNKLFIASHTAIMCRQRLFEVGKFRPELKMHCDWFAMYMIAFRYGICFVPEPLGTCNVQPGSVYTGGIQRKEEYRGILSRMLEYLTRDEFNAPAERVRKGGSLFLFGKPMLQLLVSNRRYRGFLTPTFLRKNLWHIAKLEVKRFLPRSLANLYFRLAGYRARTSS